MHYTALLRTASCAVLMTIGQALLVEAQQAPNPPQPVPTPVKPDGATPPPPAIEAPPATPGKVIDDAAGPGGDPGPDAVPKKPGKAVTKRVRRAPAAEQGNVDEGDEVGPRVVRKVVRTEGGRTVITDENGEEIRAEALDRAKAAIDNAKAQLTVQKTMLARRGADARGVFANGTSRRTMVLPTAATDPTAFSQAHEDLATMHRLLAKATHSNRDVIRFGEEREFDAMYLEGFGAVFLLNVDYPLAEAPKVEKKPAETVKDPDWEEERQLAKGDADPTFRRFGGGEAGTEIEFNSDRVNRLKTRLIDTIKHSANIRVLKQNEDVIIVVAGRNQTGPAMGMMGGMTGNFGGVGFGGGGGGGLGGGAQPGAFPSPNPLVGTAVAPGGINVQVAPIAWSMINTDHGLQSAMVLRVKKLAIDDLTSGKMSADDFRSKVDVRTY